MSPDKHPTIAENEAQTEDAPLTKEMFSANLQQLIERARAAGLNPIQTMAKTYVKQGMAILEGLLASLESDDNSKKKA